VGIREQITHSVNWIGRAGYATVIYLSAALFLTIYLPAVISLAVFGHYPHLVDTLAVLFFTSLAVVLPASISLARLPSYHLHDNLRIRENRGWLLIALFSLIVLLARTIYAVDELSSGPTGENMRVADALFGVSFAFLIAGLIMMPWSETMRPSRTLLLDAVLVVIALATLFWPLLIAPVLEGDLAGVVPGETVTFFIVGISVLSATVFWIVLRDVRSELRPVAVAFVLSVSAMVVVQLAYLSFAVATQTAASDPVGLLTTNVATSISFLLIAIAALFRLMSVVTEREEADKDDVVAQSPVRIWQIILPYPIIAVLLAMRFLMEVLDWRTEYRTGMVAGIGIVAILMMFRQLQMLWRNQYLYRRVANSATRDALTGLFNHRAIHDVLQAELARTSRRNGMLAVLFLDLDRFKSLNDLYGHKQGDLVLVSAADIIEENVRGGDIVGRYGGEEFMVVAPSISEEGAWQLGERLRKRIEDQEFIFWGARVPVTVSVGVAIFPQDSDDPEELIDLADIAMYRAKQTGRNRTVLYQHAEAELVHQSERAR
jgi:diguanylate cyclase (GGDEF)-like protein